MESRSLRLDSNYLRSNIRTSHHRRSAQSSPTRPTVSIGGSISHSQVLPKKPTPQVTQETIQKPKSETTQYINKSQQKSRARFDTEFSRPKRSVHISFDSPRYDSSSSIQSQKVAEVQNDETEFDQKSKKLKWYSKKLFLSPKTLLPAMAVLLFIIGCGVAFQSFKTARNVQASASNNYEQITGQDAPNEDEQSKESLKAYQVASDMPRYIKIPKIDVENRVVSVNVKEDNELRVPGNIFDVGWYQGSSKPGAEGASIMVAHVHGPTKPGAFYNLKKLSEGDEVQVERGDGKILKYKVNSTETVPYDQVDMNKVVRPIETGEKGLNLITCGGKYNKDLETYEKRVIVYATQIN
ncbi:class F sortase [Candidatus Saccharibacteria bacterium]|nr:class F sortase [Candidatus Saccharibacteria bacterium]